MRYGQGQGRPRSGAVRPRGEGQKNRKGQMMQLMQDAMIGRQIRMARMQQNQARGNRNAGPSRQPRQSRQPRPSGRRSY